jgi:hypothetical protein
MVCGKMAQKVVCFDFRATIGRVWYDLSEE